jgi:DNA-binding MarR family transcriptional regulator
VSRYGHGPDEEPCHVGWSPSGSAATPVCVDGRVGRSRATALHRVGPSICGQRPVAGPGSGWSLVQHDWSIPFYRTLPHKVCKAEYAAHVEVQAQTLNEMHDVVHQRVRLHVLAVLDKADLIGFTELKQLLELSDGNLNRHLAVLAEAGYVKVEKDSGRGKQRTVVRATQTGRHAFRAEVDAFRRLIGD